MFSLNSLQYNIRYSKTGRNLSNAQVTYSAAGGEKILYVMVK